MATVTEHPKPSAALEPRRSRRGRLPFSPWHLLLLPTAVVFALPLVQMVMTSLMSDREINRFPPRFFPSHISLGTGGKDEGGYVGLFTGSEVLRWTMNTVIVMGSCRIFSCGAVKGPPLHALPKRLAGTRRMYSKSAMPH